MILWYVCLISVQLGWIRVNADPCQNWSRPWKVIVISLASLNTFAQGWGPLALAPMFGHLAKSFDSDLAAVVRFTGVCILVLGFSNFFWIPMQSVFGRRPVLIFSSLVCLVSNVWRAVATSYGSYMGACVLNGFGAGPAEVRLFETLRCWEESN